MIRYLIDTDWIIDVLHGNADAVQTLVDLAPAGLALSIISYGELYEGAYYARDPQAALAGLRSFLQGKELLPLTVAIMERFAIVRGQLPRSLRQQIGDMDLLIAATALTHNLDLVTRNLRDFVLVPGLSLYQPGSLYPTDDRAFAVSTAWSLSRTTGRRVAWATPSWKHWPGARSHCRRSSSWPCAACRAPARQRICCQGV